MKPINYYTHPTDSILQKHEAEIVAKNIMRILQRTGNTWRKLSWQEYVKERKKDAEHDIFGFSDMEKIYFDQVVNYCSSAEMANKFCKNWYSEVPEKSTGIVGNITPPPLQ